MQFYGRQNNEVSDNRYETITLAVFGLKIFEIEKNV